VNLRSTILDRYVIREVLPPFGLGVLVFTFIMLLQPITLLTGILIARGADFPTIIRLFLNLLPSILATTIPMAFLLGLLLAFGRMASDSEIVALRASGLSPLQLLRPVLVLSVLMGLLTFYLMAEAVPQANQTYRETFYTLVVSRARTGIKPRVFADDLIPGMVLYVSDVRAENGDWMDLFISDLRVPQKPQVILARTGRLVVDRPTKRVELHLEQGAIHSFEALRPALYERQRFRVADLPLPFEQFFPQLPLSKGDREMSLAELLERIDELQAEGNVKEVPRFWVEFHKKFSIPGACLVFGLLGLGLSLGSRKEARSAAFALSVGVIFVYYVLLRLGEQAGDTGMMEPWVAMWGANFVLGGVGVGLLYLNHREAAFDPLDISHYAAWLPRIRRARRLPDVVRQQAPRPRLLIRIPRWSPSIPRLLDRYIARQYLEYLALVMISFWAIFVLAEFLDLFDDIQHNKVKGKVVFHYYMFHAPFVLNLVAPVSILVTTLITFGVLSRRNEITAMKAGGISVYRATLPAVAMGVLGSLALFGLGEVVLPRANRVAAHDFNIIKGRPPQTSSYLERRWILGSDGRIYNYDYMAEGPGEEQITLNGLSVYDIDPESWVLTDRLHASRATWAGLAYDLDKGWRRSFGRQPRFRAFAATRTREIEPPSYFRREQQEPETLNYAQLRSHIASIEALGLDVVRLQVQLHRKLAFPALGVVMTLIGGALYGVAISIVVAILYWACLGVFEALGNHALLTPLLAAWAPNLLFSIAGLYMLFTLET